MGCLVIMLSKLKRLFQIYLIFKKQTSEINTETRNITIINVFRFLFKYSQNTQPAISNF